MSLLTLPVVLLLAGASEPVLVASYQSLSVDAPTVAAIAEGFRGAAAKAPLAPMPAAASDKVSRSAAMCGEDAACLATIGQREQARWVLAFGVGKVGSSLLLTAIFVDVSAGKEVMRGSRRVPEGASDWALVTSSLADEVVRRPVDPVVVQVPFEVVKPVKPHNFRPWAFVTLGVTVAFGVASTVIGLYAAGNFQLLKMANASNYTQLVQTQRGLNGSADSCLIVAALSGLVSITMFILDSLEAPVVPTE
jgi:hypothetical protein